MFNETALGNSESGFEPSAKPKSLYEPCHLGHLALSNRMVMSPMTRSRAVDGNVPNPLAPT
jgi:2,4-dienoyl-CoA reductase-like NADH-dependent reductase (Old Yellow Enzyme family)